MKILLFDMDGVLVVPYGYRSALQRTVALVGQALGFQSVALTPEDIAAFEAADASSEWDSGAMCAALLLRRAWQAIPDLALPARPPLPETPLHRLPSPDFGSFARSLRDASIADLSPLARAEQILLGDSGALTAAQADTLRAILRRARDPFASLTHCLFQELILGSPAFSATYGLPGYLNSDSYLLTYDIPTLSAAAQAGLRGWLAEPAHRAAIFTNRPSRAPDNDSATSEAEMGALCAGVEQLPIVGLGGLMWLAARRGRAAETYIKPSPVHVLAALRCASGAPLADGLLAAVHLAEDGRDDGGWQLLSGAGVWAFEDSAKGLRSASAAQRCLAQIGIDIRLTLCGVAESAIKRQALAQIGAQVFPDLMAALATRAGGFSRRKSVMSSRN